MKIDFLIFFLLFSNTLFLSSCAIFGGGEPGLQRATSYELNVPSSWETLKSKGETDRAYRLPSGNGVSVTSSCKKNLDTSLKVLTRQLLIGTRNREILKETPLVVTEGAGLFTYLKADSEGEKVHLAVIIIKKQSCIFDFTLVSPKAISHTETNEFINFAKSLSYGTK